jgi:hypothetical protein
MSELNQARIEKRARELCEGDGIAWDMEFAKPKPKYAQIELKPVLDEAGRRRYMERAQEQLLKEGSQGA